MVDEVGWSPARNILQTGLGASHSGELARGFVMNIVLQCRTHERRYFLDSGKLSGAFEKLVVDCYGRSHDVLLPHQK